MKYIVKTKSSLSARASDVYSPTGEPEECDAEEAVRRFEFLITCGKHHARVDGLPVAWASIERVSSDRAQGWDGNANTMLSQYVLDDKPVGPWAEGKVAA